MIEGRSAGLDLDLTRSPLKPEPPQRAGEASPRLLIGPLKLRQASHEELRIVERDERPLEARAAEEAHGCCIQPAGILAGDQHKQCSRFFQAHVRQIPCRHASRQQVAAGERSA